MKRIFLLSLFALLNVSVFGQLHPERKYIRSGNRAYERENYVESEESYRKAVGKAQESYAAGSNLAASLYKQERYEEAAKLYQQYGKAAQTPEESAHSSYNEGNALFQQRELEKALEAYKQSLRVNPDDQEAKFNLAYTKKMLEKDKDGGGQGDQDQQQDQNDQDQQNSGQDNPPPQDGQGDDRPSGMTPEEADAMLDAMQHEEDNTREKVDARKVPAGAHSGKNW